MHYSDFYADDSWSRVILGTGSAAHDSCTKRSPLIPLTWSPSQITCFVDMADQTTGTRYIFVVDSTGAVSAGFDTAGIGGGSPPAAPTNLRLA